MVSANAWLERERKNPRLFIGPEPQVRKPISWEEAKQIVRKLEEFGRDNNLSTVSLHAEDVHKLLALHPSFEQALADYKLEKAFMRVGDKDSAVKFYRKKFSRLK